MFKGPLALIIRMALFAFSGALAWTGAITLTGQDHACINIPLLADTVAGGTALLLGGGVTFGGTAIWSRIAKRLGGVT